ncbi:MAG: hypothetical protein Q9227_006324 [Pyrenula ochraceoflavens]
MLLPSALPCEALRTSSPAVIKSRQPTSTTSYPTQPTIASSCRALQSILGTPFPLSLPSSRTNQSNRNHPPPATASLPDQNAFKIIKSTSKPPQTAAHKRARSEYESSDEEMTYDSEKENHHPNIPHGSDAPSTPKRQRRAPLALPLGLSQSDFDALETPKAPTSFTFTSTSNSLSSEDDLDTTPRPREVTSPQVWNDNVENPHNNNNNHRHAHPHNSRDWTPEDDRLLVNVVLEKLKLSRREWDDCARLLGKDKNSLGKRWKVLVGEGNVGLRRGSGRMPRGRIIGGEWGFGDAVGD